MDNSDNNFEELEKIYAQIDVWIDEEEYEKVRDGNLGIKVDDDFWQEYLNICFPDKPHGTHSNDPAWQRAFDEKSWPEGSNNQTIIPITHVAGLSLTETWARLFYAKLLRALIKQKGTDCFQRRLDDVVTYIENHLPTTSEDTNTVKMVVLYLLELSAASESFESLGFAQRAHRVMREHKRQIKEEGFLWYYDLWARYNIGVAYFHVSRYRQAVREFNYIIREIERVKKTPDESVKLKFYDFRLGDSVLLQPSVRYRADIQLKLQLAYHSLYMLNRYFWKSNDLNLSDYMKVYARIVEAEAYQQMDDLKNSWKHLKLAFTQLANMERLPLKVDNLISYKALSALLNCSEHQGIKNRFLDLFVAYHINLLRIAYEEAKYKLSALENLTPDYKRRCQTVVKRVINLLQKVFLFLYFDMVQYNWHDRNGYYQQLAEFLAWLSKRGFEEGGDEIFSESMRNSFIGIAIKLYKKNKPGLIKSEKDKDTAACPHCTWKGFDLRRIHPEHYQWFTDAMLKFYEKIVELSQNPELGHTLKNLGLSEDKQKLIDRMIETEREVLEDLRIKDLELRYKSDKVKLPEGEDGRKLCRGESVNSEAVFAQAFDHLLTCVTGEVPEALLTYENYERITRQLTSEQYERIMNDFNVRFLNRLKYRTSHKWHNNGIYFLGLQRWNSSSPAQGRSVGGGYLLYKTDKDGNVDLGIAIDPGFDFLRNLFHMGFSLNDIDFILMSHAHPDHIRDFESIILLLHELSKRGERNKRVHVILTLGIYRRLEHIIEHPTYRYFIEPYIIDINKEIDTKYFENLPSEDNSFHFMAIDQGTTPYNEPTKYKSIIPTDASIEESNNPRINLTIKPTRAYHDDHSGYSDSFGFLIEIKLSNESAVAASPDTVTLGYTGDTKWVYSGIPDPLSKKLQGRIIKGIAEQYHDCQAVIVHLGSLIDTKKSFEEYYQCLPSDANVSKECEELIREENHPYLIGMIRLLTSLYSQRHTRKKELGGQLVLMGEFGEELRGGIRTDLYRRMRHAYGDVLDFLPLDVGMEVRLWYRPDKYTQDSHSYREHKVWCVQCEKFINLEDADFECYGVDEALYCVCRTCRRATPINVLQDRLRHLYDVGIEPKAYEGNL